MCDGDKALSKKAPSIQQHGDDLITATFTPGDYYPPPSLSDIPGYVAQLIIYLVENQTADG